MHWFLCDSINTPARMFGKLSLRSSLFLEPSIGLVEELKHNLITQQLHLIVMTSKHAVHNEQIQMFCFRKEKERKKEESTLWFLQTLAADVKNVTVLFILSSPFPK